MAYGRGASFLAPFFLFSNALIWISSVIVLGITAWFIHTIGNSGGRHLTYILVVAVLSTIVYPLNLILSRSNSRRGHLMPLSLVFSYLWLAAFVVSTDDWAAEACPWGPGPFGHCAYKHTVMAFSFIAFFFAALNTAAEGYLARRGDGAVVGEKPARHSADVAAAPGTRGTAVV